MKFEQILNDLKNKKYHPIYLLAGEESFFIDQISDHIENSVLDDMEKEFNQSILYGKDTNVAKIVATAKRFPMMSNHQVVIVKEAQEIKKLDELSAYAENPLESTILVVCHKYKKIDKRKSLAKVVKKSGVLFESNKLYDNQVPDWINQQFSVRGYTIRPKAAIMLSEFLGTDLSKISNEIEKLVINIPKGSEITDDDIERNIGISKDYNVFELQKAIGKRDEVKCQQIVNYFAANEKNNPLVVVTGILYGFFSKLLIFHQLKDKSKMNVAKALSVNPFFVGDYQLAARNFSVPKLAQVIKHLREYDLKSKGVGNISSKDGELLKELIFKILH